MFDGANGRARRAGQLGRRWRLASGGAFSFSVNGDIGPRLAQNLEKRQISRPTGQHDRHFDVAQPTDVHLAAIGALEIDATRFHIAQQRFRAPQHQLGKAWLKRRGAEMHPSETLTPIHSAIRA